MRGNLYGIVAMILSQSAFVVNDALIKLATGHLPAGQSIFLRGLFATAFAVAVAAWTRQLLHPLPPSPSPARYLLGWRTVAEVGSTFFYLAALFHMPIGDATAILQVLPLAITAAAAVFLGEPVGWRRWLATLVGFAGVLIIIRPGTSAFSGWSLVALGSVGFMVLRDLVTRRLGAAIPTLQIVVAGSLAVTLASLALAPFEDWRMPQAKAVALLAAAALFLFAGYYFIVDAMRAGEVAVVSPFRYSIIVTAVAAGYLVWGEIPDRQTVIGTAVVASAGLYTVWRERARQAATARE